MIAAIVTIVPKSDTKDVATLGSIREVVDELNSFKVPELTKLLDGGHAHILDEEETVGGPDYNCDTVATLKAWVAKHDGLVDNTTVVYGDSIGVDLDVISAITIGCGDHMGNEGDTNNILIYVNPSCVEHSD